MKFEKLDVVQQAELNQNTVIGRLKAELKRATEERDILEKLPRTNAVAKRSFSALKKEQIKRRIHPNRAMAASDVLDYIEMFYALNGS